MEDWEMLSNLGMEFENENWYRTDEFHDVLASLKLLNTALELIKEEPIFWKWVILSTHSAVQSDCVCILTGTNGSGALDKSSETKLLEYHSLSSQKAINEANGIEWTLGNPAYPRTRISNLPELLKRLPSNMSVVIPKNVQDEDDQRAKDFDMLHEFRNQLTHFGSVGWSLEIEGLPRIIGTALTLVVQIVESENYKRDNRFHDLNMQPVITKTKNLLQQIQTTG